jgi:hypothetical protein
VAVVATAEREGLVILHLVHLADPSDVANVAGDGREGRFFNAPCRQSSVLGSLTSNL